MGATGVVKERMDLMSDLGKTMKTLKLLVDSGNTTDKTVLSLSAKEIRGHSARMPALFPTGSYAPPSEALPAIDDRRAEFDGLAQKLGVQADALAALAETPDQASLAEWFRETGRICSACHKSFREKR